MQPSGGPSSVPDQYVSPPGRETTRWAAILCFLAAFMSVGGAGWALFARWATDDSFGSLSDYLNSDTKSAVGSLDTLNTVTAVLYVIFAIALVTGGVMLLRRNPDGRPVVVGVCAGLGLMTIVGYVVGEQIWQDVVAATGGSQDVDVSRLGPELATVIRGWLFILVLLGLTLAPSTKRWLTDGAQQANAAADPALPAPSRGAATTAAVLSLLGSVVFVVGFLGTATGAFDSGASVYERVVCVIVAVLFAPIATAQMVGGIQLLRRKHSGAIAVAVAWLVVILLASGLPTAVLSVPNHRPDAVSRVLVIVVPVVLYAAVVFTLAVIPPTRRWCLAGAANPTTARPQAGSTPEQLG